MQSKMVSAEDVPVHLTCALMCVRVCACASLRKALTVQSKLVKFPSFFLSLLSARISEAATGPR